MAEKPLVAILMGSRSDDAVMAKAGEALTRLSVPFVTRVLSAHRTPDETTAFVRSASADGVRVFIAGAGGAAHLPGVVAAFTTLPVIGVPIAIAPLHGQDSLLSIVQMPRGIPVATVGIDNAFNAGLLAGAILASSAPQGDLSQRLADYRRELRESVLAQTSPG